MSTARQEALAESIFAAASAFVAKCVERGVNLIRREFEDRFRAQDERIAAIPQIKGERGEPGADGKDGRDGRSCDVAELKLLVDAAVAALPKPADGAPGERGERGEAGPPGPRGDPGQKGDTGERGADGQTPDIAPLLEQIQRAAAQAITGAERAAREQREAAEATYRAAIEAIPLPKSGERGPRGEPGQDGRDGQPGRDGEPGRDAFQVDWHDGIDEDKSYPKGACAVIRGGSFVATRATDPVVDGDLRAAGWLCLFRGISGVEETLEEGGRYLRRRTVYSDGTADDVRLKTATVIDRGIWKQAEYDRGDGVIFGGSFWIAMRDTSDKPGNGSDAWRLSVKRGKDAV